MAPFRTGLEKLVDADLMEHGDTAELMDSDVVLLQLAREIRRLASSLDRGYTDGFIASFPNCKHTDIAGETDDQGKRTGYFRCTCCLAQIAASHSVE